MTLLERHPNAARILRGVQRAGVVLGGFIVLALGVAFIILPGPAIILIPIGLAILAREFLWAQRVLDPMKQLAERLRLLAGRVFGRDEPRV